MTSFSLDGGDDSKGKTAEEQVADADTKAILLALHAELQHIRLLLASQQAAEDGSATQMACRTCGETHATETAIRAHAEAAHNAPTDIPLEDLIEA